MTVKLDGKFSVQVAEVKVHVKIETEAGEFIQKFIVVGKPVRVRVPFSLEFEG